jgi:WD40 repeat protein
MVLSVSFSPDGERIASGGFVWTVRVWDVDKGQEVLSLKGHASGVSGVSYSPYGKRIASASKDGTVRVWDVRIGQ